MDVLEQESDGYRSARETSGDDAAVAADASVAMAASVASNGSSDIALGGGDDSAAARSPSRDRTVSEASVSSGGTGSAAFPRVEPKTPTAPRLRQISYTENGEEKEEEDGPNDARWRQHEKHVMVSSPSLADR